MKFIGIMALALGLAFTGCAAKKGSGCGCDKKAGMKSECNCSGKSKKDCDCDKVKSGKKADKKAEVKK